MVSFLQRLSTESHVLLHNSSPYVATRGDRKIVIAQVRRVVQKKTGRRMETSSLKSCRQKEKCAEFHSKVGVAKSLRRDEQRGLYFLLVVRRQAGSEMQLNFHRTLMPKGILV